MATDRRFLPAFLADDASFRTWAQGIEAQILAVGLALASDTGQLDLTTATRPATVTTFAGFKMYRFNDSLQATKPFFLKVEYGVGGATDRPALRVSCGTVTNGAGTFTGTYLVTTTNVLAGASKSAGNTLESFCSGSSARVLLAHNVDPANGTYGFGFIAERTVDPDGTPNGDGVFFWAFTGGAVSSFVLVPFTGTMPTFTSVNSPFNLVSWQQMSNGLNVALQPLTLMVNGRCSLATFLRYTHTDIGELTTISVPHLGSTRTMMPLGDGVGSSTMLFVAGMALAVLWE